MARPREFDAEVAVNDAMNVFWALGYDSASMPDLLDGMGIGRSSLYKAFQDKKSLFMIVLSQYETQFVNPAVALLMEDGDVDGGKRILHLLSDVVSAVRRGDRRGCLLCSAAAGPAVDDVDVAKAVHRALDKMRNGFETALGDAAAYVSSDIAERRQVADGLTAYYVGLRVLARSQASLASLERSVEAVARMFDLAKRS